MTYVFEIDKSISDAGNNLFAKSRRLEVSFNLKSNQECSFLPIRKYMKSYFPWLVSSTIALSIV
jgi:hypothetical protein